MILFLVTAAGPDAIAQQRLGYRVELLVLRHLDSVAEPRPVMELPDLSDALDLRDRQSETVDAFADPFYLGPPVTELRPPLGPFEQEEGPWADIRLIESRSERMNAVWRNLRLSSEFRPEAFLAWEQPADAPFPLLRIHGEEVFSIDDPFEAARRTVLGSARADSGELPSPWAGYLFQYSAEDGALILGSLPEPYFHYVLDGSVHLRRSRFLHLDLDLAWHPPAPVAAPTNPGPPLLAEFQGRAAHELKQSRQVRTERMEYFDSPVLGALVWITEIEMPAEEAFE